jgi:hypothetical protein
VMPLGVGWSVGAVSRGIVCILLVTPKWMR